MLVAEKFIRSLVEKYGKHTVYTMMGVTWYEQACNIIGLKHYLYSSIEKSMMERVNQYFKDRIEVLMIIIHAYVKMMDIIYFMYITGYNSLFQYTMIRYTKMNSLFSYKKR